MPQTRITLADLKQRGACEDYRDAFVELFPDGVDVTPELCKTHAAVFNWNWAAEYLLTPEAWDVYTVAEPALDRAHGTVYKDANAAYSGTVSPLREDYSAEADRIRNDAYAVFTETMNTARVVLDEGLAAVWADAFLSDANEGWDES